MSVLFVDKVYLDEKSQISANFDFKIVAPVIELVQFKYIKKYLGHDLYNAIITHVEAYIDSATTIPAAYKTLLDDYIKPSMLWHIQAELAIPARFRIEPKGIGENSGDNFTPITTDDLEMFINEYRNNAQSYGQEMENYIRQRGQNVYPEYYTNSGLDENQPNNSAYQTPFYFTNTTRVGRTNDADI